MPWDGQSFRKHNKKLTSGQAEKAAAIANAVRRSGKDDSSAIRIANAKIKESIRKHSARRRAKSGY